MFKKLLLSLGCFLFVQPSYAASTLRTEANDIVSIYAAAYGNDASPSYEKTYKKPWGKVKLDAKTINKMKAILAQTKPYKEYSETFRVAHLVLVNDEIQRVLFVSDGGTAIAIEMSGGPSETSRYCQTSVGGNGFIVGGCNKDPM